MCRIADLRAEIGVCARRGKAGLRDAACINVRLSNSFNKFDIWLNL